MAAGLFTAHLASMHCAAFRNPGDTSLELGHGGSLKVFERHYRDRVEEAQARAFWEIYPAEKIVPMPVSPLWTTGGGSVSTHQ